ncbi:MAG TPA: hypothetical protein VGS16_08820 [Candidatus Dormibacteraeota bacterium]|nr:hypothetical protein [Candidatus Dormibacteraeota bacterium]
MDEPWLFMQWDHERRGILAEWKAFATSEEFRGALTKAIEVIRERRAVCFVNDTRKLELITDEDQRWILQTWTPQAVAAGLQRIAIVIAHSGLSKMAVETMFKDQATARVESRTFDSLPDAMQWVATP